MLKLAAVDIGSNAIRMQVTHVTEFNNKFNFKRLEYLRFPLRLGKDVFNLGYISETNREKFLKLMHAFKLLIELYEVNDYMICATSAMRESTNGRKLAEEVKEKLGLKIMIIDGNREAELINKAIKSSMTDDQAYLHIDVGGGSTELNLYIKNEKIKAHSFKIGSVRRLEKHDTPQNWQRMQKWIKDNILKSYGKITAIGTGGNINKVFEIAGKKPGKSLSLKKIIAVKEDIEKHSMDERINLLQLNPDRADVIIPASEIYIAVMKMANCKSIIVPDAGLKDGLMQSLFEKHLKKTHKNG